MTMSEFKTPMQKRAAEEKRLRKLLSDHRRNKRRNKMSEADMRDAIIGNDSDPKWVKEILFLMERAHTLPLAKLCEMVDINRKTLMAFRRKHPQLERACTDFLAATFEDEMEDPHRQIRPGILTLAADRIIPTFMKDSEGRMTEEDAALLVRTILDSLRTRLGASGLPQAEQQTILQHIAGDIRHEFAKRAVD